MGMRIIRLLEMFERVLKFCETQLPEGVAMPADFTANQEVVKNVVQKLRTAVVDQQDGATTGKDGTVVKRSAKSILRRQLLKLGLLVRAFPGDFPEAKFSVPQSKDPNEQIVKVSRQILRTARQYKERFIALGRPADFIEQLQEAIRNFERAADRQRTGVGIRIYAGGEADLSANEGAHAVVRMNAIAASMFEDDPVRANAWKSARNVEDAPVRKKEAEKSPLRK